jgi:hypothetical protein
MLGAALIHPAKRAGIPLRPAPMIKHDGTAKNAGERHAAKRCMAKLRQDHPHLQCLSTEERLSATAPPIETLPEHGCHSLLGGKEGDHASLFQQVQVAEHAGRVTYDNLGDFRKRTSLVQHGIPPPAGGRQWGEYFPEIALQPA